MLVLSRKVGERLLIGTDVVVTVVRICPNAVRLGIEAPKDWNIVREELGPVRKIQPDESDIADLGRRPMTEEEAGFIPPGACVIDDAV